MIGPRRHVWQARRSPSQPFSFFSLDGGSQWEDTSYAPARVEGRGVNPGHECAALLSHNPWSIRASARIILAGNKFGRSQVFTVI